MKRKHAEDFHDVYAYYAYIDRVFELLAEALDHLDYCGWGDGWEREVSQNIRKRADDFKGEHDEAV